MHLPKFKLLCYTCTAIATGGMSAQAQNTPEGNDLLLDDWQQSPIAGDDLNADLVPETTAILAQQVRDRTPVSEIKFQLYQIKLNIVDRSNTPPHHHRL